MPLQHQVGEATIIVLPDGEGPFFEPRTKAFPTATADDWRKADETDPASVTAGGDWLLRFRCFAIRLGGRTVIVDAGIGPADSPAAAWAPVPGRLPASLAEAGIDPGDVDTVVLTHLHTDHIGWAMQAGKPFFPNARYVMQQTEIEAIAEHSAPAGPYALDPLRAAGLLDAVDGEHRLAPGLRVIHTPGHTPGHQCVLLEDGGDLVVVTGDLFVHAVQVVAPETAYTHEMDPELARTTRVALLREAREKGATLAVSHLGDPFIKI
ncbi:MBL fold metallo-hydrolase [Asanoa ishikariensis]|uniref:Metallo-beta-lactamase superfamily protein n=1 Tax=Asanoa ishikariensis TaxID=137265 RepID=A0A1H3M7D8_9ACTN|nr:MBL fold metallo-hydrolase [Asanoa ishikariensis]GIF65926.1 MBL fold metallo-hydrolase [Asanoa ishikariensis]SDY71945.1 Metallo-beta-lactamase superfamily protein [Asanoa ishikariensis]